ncbi:MAG: hypothetical protein QXO75_04600 [Nitrososphaerota archaeon]
MIRARRVARTTNNGDLRKLVSTAGLLLVDAMIFNDIIAASHSQVKTLSTLRGSPNLKKELEDSWDYIIKNIDYEPVLDIALRILKNLPASPQLNSQLQNLLDLAYDIASSKVLLRHDLFGRIYHTLLLGNLVKYYATLYTKIPSARLLARLLVNLPSGLKVDVVPPNYNGEPIRVVDFACGSGTLLSAIYKELDVKSRNECESFDPKILHKYLVEEGMWGFDVLQHAVHLASTVLLLHNPVPVDRSRLYALRLGCVGDNKYLGSLDFLRSSSIAPDMLLFGGTTERSRKISAKSEEIVGVKLPPFHICIMNPPFTRSVGGNLLFGGLSKDERKELQKYFAQVLKELNLSGIGQAGLGAAFVFLADKYLEEGGRIGLVLPRAVLSGVSWGKVRDLLLENYQLEYIITSYEGPNGWNFSENTNLSEVLLVARKRKKRRSSEEDKNYNIGSEGDKVEGERDYTFFVNLKKRPTNELESIYLGSKLKDIYSKPELYDIKSLDTSPYFLKIGGKTVGEVYSSLLEENNIGAYNFFYQTELNRVVLMLREGIVYLPDQGKVGSIELTNLSNLGAEIGPDVRQIHDAFKVTNDQGIYKTFWGYDSSVINTISQKPNAYLAPKNADKARELWKKRGKLLIVERAWLSTYTVLAIYLDSDVLSNVWWSIRLDDQDAKLLTIWMNSTIGLILLTSIAEITRGPWVKFKKEHLSNMPVLNVRKLNNNARDALLRLYDQVCNLKFQALPEEFRKPTTRRVIDERLCQVLGLKADFQFLYEMLSKEPMITGE